MTLPSLSENSNKWQELSQKVDDNLQRTDTAMAEHRSACIPVVLWTCKSGRILCVLCPDLPGIMSSVSLPWNPIVFHSARW